MQIGERLIDSARSLGADYCGIADLSSAKDAITDQGDAMLSGFPRSVSIGVALFHPIVNELPRRQERAVAASYRTHCYDVVNDRLDAIASRLASLLQREGHGAYPVAASKRVDDDRLCGVFSHKLGAHLAGLGWIGKNCLLITPDMGPRVRWATVLTDAPLEPTGRSMEERCGDCRECVDICPVRAFKGRPFRTEAPREDRFHAARCDRYLSWMRRKNAETAVCGLCLYVCPHGRKGPSEIQTENKER